MAPSDITDSFASALSSYVQAPGLFRLIAHAAKLTIRQLILLQPILIGLLVLLLLMPRSEDGLLLNQPAAWAVYGALFLFTTALTAGWLAMANQAALSWSTLFYFLPLPAQVLKKAVNQASSDEKEAKETGDSVHEEKADQDDSSSLSLTEVLADYASTPVKEALDNGPMRLLNEFLGGVSQFFIPVTVGLLVQLAVGLAVLLISSWLIMDVIGVPVGLEQAARDLVQASSGQDEALLLAKAEAMINALPLETLSQWFAVLSGGLLVYSLFSVATMFWMQFLVIYQRSVWSAYAFSFKQLLRDPWIVLLLSSVYGIGALVLQPLALAGLPSWLGALVDFVGLLFTVFFSLLCFLYIQSRCGVPQLAEQLPAVKALWHQSVAKPPEQAKEADPSDSPIEPV